MRCKTISHRYIEPYACPQPAPQRSAPHRTTATATTATPAIIGAISRPAGFRPRHPRIRPAVPGRERGRRVPAVLSLFRCVRRGRAVVLPSTALRRRQRRDGCVREDGRCRELGSAAIVGESRQKRSSSGMGLSRTGPSTLRAHLHLGRTYSGARANSAAGGGLRVAAAVAARRGLLGETRRGRGLRCKPLPAASRKVPRHGQRDRVPYLPQGAVDHRLVGLRRQARSGFRFRAHSRRVDPPGLQPGGILRPRGRSLPNLQLEPPGAVVRSRCATRAEAAPSSIDGCKSTHRERVNGRRTT